MASEERNILANLIGEVLVNSYFAYAVWQMVASGGAAAPDAVQVWARMVIWVIPIGIGLAIAFAILSAIAVGIAGLPKEKVQQDERDRGILIKGMAVTMVLAGISFVTALSALAYGCSAFTGLNIIFFGFGIAAAAGDLAKLLMYRVWG